MSRFAIVSRIAHDGLETPALAGERPWWDELDPRFARGHERFALGALDRAKVTLTAGSDVVLRTLGAGLVGSLALPLGYHPLAIRAARRDRSFYGALAATGDAAQFFERPPRGEPLRFQTRRARMPWFRPDDGVVEDLRFESTFETVNPEYRSRYARHSANRHVHARMFRHQHGPRALVIAIHGFSADLYHLNEWFFAIPWLYEEGYDVLLFTLPFHGARQGPLSPFSGHGFFAGGAWRINEAFAHAVWDLRRLVDHFLDHAGAPRVGATGVSLGGCTTALLASAEERLAFAIPNVPVTSIADLVLEWEPIGSAMRAMLAAGGISIQEAREMVAPSCALSWRAAIAKERLMIIGGVGDRLAPPKHSRVLWEHWGRPRLHWFPGSHLVHLDRGKYFREMRRFLRA